MLFIISFWNSNIYLFFKFEFHFCSFTINWYIKYIYAIFDLKKIGYKWIIYCVENSNYWLSFEESIKILRLERRQKRIETKNWIRTCLRTGQNAPIRLGLQLGCLLSVGLFQGYIMRQHLRPAGPNYLIVSFKWPRLIVARAPAAAPLKCNYGAEKGGSSSILLFATMARWACATATFPRRPVRNINKFGRSEYLPFTPDFLSSHEFFKFHCLAPRFMGFVYFTNLYPR